MAVDQMTWLTHWIRRTDAQEAQAGEELCRQRSVRLMQESPDEYTYLAADGENYLVRIGRNGSCTCSCATFRADRRCRHVIAALTDATRNGYLEVLAGRYARENADRLLDAMETSFPQETTAKLEVTLTRMYDQWQLSLRIGHERLYVVHNLQELLDAMRTGASIRYGKQFVFEGGEMRFDPPEQRLLDLLSLLMEAGLGADRQNRQQLLLPDSALSRVLEILRETPFVLADGEKRQRILSIETDSVPLRFRAEAAGQGLRVQAEYPEDLRAMTEDTGWVLFGGRLVQTEAEQRPMLRLLMNRGTDGRCVFLFGEEAGEAVSELIPYLKLLGTVTLSEPLNRRILREPLKARVYLDRAGSEISARLAFGYGQEELNPFDAERKRTRLASGERIILRDLAGERQILNLLDEAGFVVRSGQAILQGNDRIYDFITGGTAPLQACSEVWLSRDFERMQPRKPHLRLMMRVNAGKLELKLEDGGEPTAEILGIMQALARKRDYFRLKDGTFLDLTGMSEWEPAAAAVAEAAVRDSAAEGEVLLLSTYRAAYLDSLLRETGAEIGREDSFVETVQALDGTPAVPALPAGLALRPYQERGYAWLHTLDRLAMGGILADDMGLGKTVEVIALLKTLKGCGQPSLVVAPTSLTYNWLAELQRFAPELSVMVLGGTAEQRAAMLNHVREAGDIDVLITSYPLIRRDSALMKDIDFRTAVLDEAQQIKNADSVGAAAVKQLHAHTRFALTGTPLENHIDELWSLFDFVLPGYLDAPQRFVRRYQDGRKSEDLRRRIRPFLMRRMKTDVLTELPDKIETVMAARMTPEQEKVYRAAAARLSGRVDRLLAEKGFDRGRMEVLSAITELRQICCHPALVLDGYSGSSGKLEMLLDLLPGALAAGHRVLLFSQFTSMLHILRPQLEGAGIRCLYLDGKTPADRRLELCEQFNAGQGDVFLISLRAGGTGLNLTGADLVIHYDPWWNPAVEDQATDRAHRIGQTHKVEVVRLITHGAIEEQVLELGRRKRALFDRLITPGEELVTGLSEQDIRRLFQ